MRTALLTITAAATLLIALPCGLRAGESVEPGKALPSFLEAVGRTEWGKSEAGKQWIAASESWQKSVKRPGEKDAVKALLGRSTAEVTAAYLRWAPAEAGRIAEAIYDHGMDTRSGNVAIACYSILYWTDYDKAKRDALYNRAEALRMESEGGGGWYGRKPKEGTLWSELQKIKNPTGSQPKP